MAPKVDSSDNTGPKLKSNFKGLARFLGCFHSLLSQPPCCLFLLSLVLVCISLFPLGIYVQNNTDIPDLDTMIKWNAPLGTLPSVMLCPASSAQQAVSKPCGPGACVLLPFLVPHQVVQEYNQRTLTIQLSGSYLKSRNKYHILVGDTLYIDLKLSVSNDSEPDYSGKHKMYGYVTYCTEDASLSLTMREFDEDRNKSEISHASSTLPCPPDRIPVLPGSNVNVSLSTNTQLCRSDQVITPDNEQFRHRGLVYFFLTAEQRIVSAQRLYIASLLVLVVTVAFAVLVCLTDQTSKK